MLTFATYPYTHIYHRILDEKLVTCYQQLEELEVNLNFERLYLPIYRSSILGKPIEKNKNKSTNQSINLISHFTLRFGITLQSSKYKVKKRIIISSSTQSECIARIHLDQLSRQCYAACEVYTIAFHSIGQPSSAHSFVSNVEAFYVCRLQIVAPKYVFVEFSAYTDT